MNAAIDLNDDGPEHGRVQVIRRFDGTKTPAAFAMAEIPGELGLGHFDKSRDVASVQQHHGERLLAWDGPLIALDSMNDKYTVEVVRDRRGMHVRLDRPVSEACMKGIRFLLMPVERSDDELRLAIADHVWKRMDRYALEQLAKQLGCRP